MGFAILLVDLLTGPLLLFPVFFIVPVALAAWFYSTRWAYGLAVLLPLGRCLIADLENQAPLIYSVANALIRIGVLAFMAYLIGLTAKQTRALRETVAGLVTMCAWSKTVEYQGEWLSFEEYLKRRFNVDTSHGISPAEAEKVFKDFKENAENR